MGAGRKIETYTLAQDSQYFYGPMNGRNLKKGDLCGVIFGCKFSTIKECYAKKLFGLPAPHFAYIQNIDPGLTLFLFNYSDRTLHGIFEAASEGKLNIDPKAWSPNGTDPSPYPAQVKVRVRMRCEPLDEEKFRPAIADNYKDEKMFSFELDKIQTNKLFRMFSPSPSSVKAASTSKYAPPPQTRKAIPASSLVEIGDIGATHVDKWSSLFKSSDDSSENKGNNSKEGAHKSGSKVVNLGKPRGWEVATNSNADEQKVQPSVAQSGASYSSVLRNTTSSSAIGKKSSSAIEVPSKASKGVATNPWSSSSRVLSLGQHSEGFKNASQECQDVIGASKKDYAEDTDSEIDWDATSSFRAHLVGLNEILDDPKDKDCFKRFDGNMGFASSSSMVLNHWEDVMGEEGNTDKSPCGSSYVSAMTGDAVEDNGEDRERHHMDRFNMDIGSPTYLDILSAILAEVRELKLTQTKQTEYMMSLQMEVIELRQEILRLKKGNVSS